MGLQRGLMALENFPEQKIDFRENSSSISDDKKETINLSYSSALRLGCDG